MPALAGEVVEGLGALGAAEVDRGDLVGESDGWMMFEARSAKAVVEGGDMVLDFRHATTTKVV